MGLHALRIALGTIIRAAVLIVADQLLLLRIDRNDRLPGRLALDHMSVDVLELSIAIRMFRTLVGLAIGLPTEAKRRQQPPHAGGADLVAHLAQRGGELVVALRNPEQRTHRIAERRKFHDAPQILDQRRVPARQRAATAARLTNAARRKRPAIELLKPRPSVERAYPVIFATASSPPRPAARTSPAANNRRRRSSSFEPTSFQRRRIACVSIMLKGITPSDEPRNPPPSQITKAPKPNNQFNCSGGCP